MGASQLWKGRKIDENMDKSELLEIIQFLIQDINKYKPMFYDSYSYLATSDKIKVWQRSRNTGKH